MNLPYEDYRDDWNRVLPDGPAFNHWGGRVISERLIGLLQLEPMHSVLDVCCGEGGTLSLLPPVRFKCGVDISEPALKRCRKRNPDAVLVNADAHKLPFEDNSFDRIFSQDADAWMQGNPSAVLSEIARVLKPGGTFVFQNYMRSRAIPGRVLADTSAVLRASGYMRTDLLVKDDLLELFQAAGLLIKEIHDVHEEYSVDNARMLEAARSLTDHRCTLLPLLEWEKNLFLNEWWTGLILVANSAKACPQS